MAVLGIMNGDLDMSNEGGNAFCVWALIIISFKIWKIQRQSKQMGSRWEHSITFKFCLDLKTIRLPTRHSPRAWHKIQSSKQRKLRERERVPFLLHNPLVSIHPLPSLSLSLSLSLSTPPPPSNVWLRIS